MFASSRTISAPFPDKVAFFGHVAFKQLQIHSFFIVYALYTSYKHWPVVSDRFASCLDHFPAQFALFLPCMSSPQTFKKKVFLVTKNGLLSCNRKCSRSNQPHSYYIDRANHTTTQPLSKNAQWSRCYQHYCVYQGSKPRHRTTRPVRGQLQKGEVHENRERDRGRVREQGVREQQRLGMSQGIMTCEPSQEGDAPSNEVVGLQ